MTIAERINLHKCGYTRAEIDALAKEEKETPGQRRTKDEEIKGNLIRRKGKPDESWSLLTKKRKCGMITLHVS